jgi:menaquinone-dependent protoporphyrinogen oxidase
MSNRILVTYATRAGSTGEVATAIGKALTERGFAVDVTPIEEKPPVDGYQAVLIGSAVRMGQWLPEAVNYIKTHQGALNALPVALFTVHLNNLGGDEESQKNRNSYLDTVRPLVNPVAEAFFAGKMDFARLSFLDRLIAKVVKAPEHDLRDWNKVRAWAEEVEPMLGPTQ